MFKQVAEISVKGIDRRGQLLAIVTLPKGRLLLTVSERRRRTKSQNRFGWMSTVYNKNNIGELRSQMASSYLIIMIVLVLLSTTRTTLDKES